MSSAPTRVVFRRTGGFAGTFPGMQVDTAKLDPAAATEIHALAQALPLTELAAERPTPSKPDAFQYDVRVETAEGTRELRVGEHSVPDELRPLIDRLTRAAREQHRKR